MAQRKKKKSSERASDAPQRRFITKLSVERLFGTLTYLDVQMTPDKETGSWLHVLYGDNGTGKTTILTLIYSVLSTERRGHRTYLAQTPFARFGIEFSDGATIKVEKVHGLKGDYKYISQGFEPNISAAINTESDGSVKMQDSVIEIEEFLERLDIDVLFVDHERRVRSTFPFLTELAQDDVKSFQSDPEYYIAYQRRLALGPADEVQLKFPLQEIVRALNALVRDQAFKQGSRGDIDASSVYLEVARTLVKPKKRGPAPDKLNVEIEIEDLSETTRSYIAHGLLADYPFEEFTKVIKQAPKSKRISVEDVVLPFVNSIKRRVSALAGLHQILTTFEKELNKYFLNKSVSLHVLHGLRIHNRERQLDLSQLSSGERQLVFLLCAAVVSRSTPALILIDEPELSLNYKWQRMIAGSLADLSDNQTTQFVMASHSIEVITRYEESSFELVGADDKADS